MLLWSPSIGNEFVCFVHKAQVIAKVIQGHDHMDSRIEPTTLDFQRMIHVKYITESNICNYTEAG